MANIINQMARHLHDGDPSLEVVCLFSLLGVTISLAAKPLLAVMN